MIMPHFVDELLNSVVSSMILVDFVDEKSIVESDKTFRRRFFG